MNGWREVNPQDEDLNEARKAIRDLMRHVPTCGTCQAWSQFDAAVYTLACLEGWTLYHTVINGQSPVKF
jgi:hypothetical protein